MATIVTYKGVKYDVTKFAERHPGGKDLILEHAGKDITQAFDDAGHSEGAHAVMRKYRLKSNDSGNASAPAEASASTKTETSEAKLIVLYDGERVDVTRFADNHPAGRALIEEYNGKDIYKVFNDVGHSKGARRLLQKYRVDKDGKPLDLSTSDNAPVVKVLSKKLFTEEDKYFIHKTLGLFAVLSFVYRYLILLPLYGNLGFDNSGWFEWLSLLLHQLLSTSSLIFHVLEKRIAKNPLVIYEEYRLHAIVFTLRSVGVSIIGMLAHLLPDDIVVKRCVLGGYILACHLVVDLITKWYGTPGTTAVRNKDDGRFAQIKIFFSYYQFTALASHLVWSPYLPDFGFNTAIAIQSSAFLMTLKRKGLIRWTTYVIVYGGSLLVSMLQMLIHFGPLWFIPVAFAFFLRCKFRVNKYLLWMTYALAVYATHDPTKLPAVMPYIKSAGSAAGAAAGLPPLNNLWENATAALPSMSLPSALSSFFDK